MALPRILTIIAAAGPIILSQPAERITDSNALGWYGYSGDHYFGNSPWGAHLDLQWRRAGVILGWQQLSARSAVIYKPSDRWTIMAGYNYQRTYPYGAHPDPYAYPEHRTYQEASVRHDSGKLDLGHRLRFEQRVLGQLSTDPPEPTIQSWSYQNRFRYQVDAQHPLSRDWYVQLAAEPHIRFGWNYRGRAIDQIRIYGGIGRRFSESWRMETGYLYQVGVPRTGVVYETNHILQLTLYGDVRLFGRRNSH